MATDERAQREVLARQLAMNKDSWQALRDHGVDEWSELRLDFFYDAPGEPQAESLAAFIREETDYEVDAGGQEAGLLKKKSWTVSGTTQPTTVSLEILDQWVDWMVAAGFEHGCEFDGWGAQVP